MKQLLVFAFLLLAQLSWSQTIPPRPNPPRLVNDYQHAMSADQVEALERKLVAYDDSTSIQVAIITYDINDDYPIEMVALKILREWGVGNKKTNNGIVILADIAHRKIRIETGGGMEGSIPDITAKQIIESEIAPNFRNQNYYRGFDEATDAIIKAAAGEYKAPEDYRKRGNKGGSIIGMIVIFIIILIVLSNIGGGGRGGMMSRRGFSPWIFPMGGWTGGGGGGGGWSGGGGGGGFGGFGGGGGGGGGASGSW
ncbi:MAG: TPM domain-containing protein [Chitinophagaceae bacterium]